jgi:acyl-CoA thioesterase-2
MHAGKQELPVDYHVTRLRDGGSFAARVVTALQNSTIIFSAQMSFCPMKVR